MFELIRALGQANKLLVLTALSLSLFKQRYGEDKVEQTSINLQLEAHHEFYLKRYFPEHCQRTPAE